MQLSHEDLLEQKGALLEIMTIERRRRNYLRIQAAQHGNLTPIHIRTDLDDTERKLATYEKELAQLETQIAEADESVAEVEYRVHVAEAWNTPLGRPTVGGAARLELARLRLGITPERASIIEQEIRTALAREVFTEIDVSILLGLESIPSMPFQTGMQVYISPTDSAQIHIEAINMSQIITQADAIKAALRLLGRVVRLDRQVGVRLLLLSLPTDPFLSVETFASQLFDANQTQLSDGETNLFNAFIQDIQVGLSQR